MKEFKEQESGVEWSGVEWSEETESVRESKCFVAVDH
jgi:hypothetical protein